MTDHTARDLMHRCRFATRNAAQWTGSGPRGAAGVPALYLVEEAAGREHATAQTQPHSLGVTNVKDPTYRLIFATVILVPFMATGAHGVVGELVVARATEGR